MTRTFPIDIPGLDVDDSLCIKVLMGWDQLFEVDYEAAVIFGEKVLYLGKSEEYGNLLEMVKKGKYSLGLDEKANFYLLREAEIIE